MVKHQSTHWCIKSSTADHYQGDIDIAQDVVMARAISISNICCKSTLFIKGHKNHSTVSRSFLSATARDSSLIGFSLAIAGCWWESKKRTGGKAIATHGDLSMIVTMPTVAECLFLVQSIQNPSGQCKIRAQQSLKLGSRFPNS